MSTLTGSFLAWETTVNDMTAVTFAATAAAARWNAVKSYREAGYGRPGQWPPVKAKRLPMLDDSPLKAQGRKCWVPEYAMNYPF